MKRLLVLLLLISSLLALVSCNTLEGLMKDLGIEYGDTVEKDEDEKIPVHPNTDKNDESEKPEENGGGTNSGDNTENGGNTEGGDDGEDTVHTYKSFTAAEKELMSSVIGFVIPFIPNDEYYVEEYTDEEYGEHGINFYSFDNTKAEFDAYLEKFSSYTFDKTDTDSYGDTWYYYLKGDIYVDVSFYYYDGAYVVDLYAYSINENGNSDNTGGGSSDNDDEITFAYEDFTAAEKALMNDRLGLVIPFIPNNEYYVEAYDDEDYGEHGIEFYTYGNTEMQFALYRLKFSDYNTEASYEDQYGDTWYCYSKGDLYIDMSFYYYEGDYVVHVFAYFADEGGSGSTGGGSNTPANVITNSGAGLPEGKDGVYGVDFTKAENVKDVTDQGSYQDGCPTTGSPAVLVIPVQFSNATAASKGYTIDKLVEAFEKGGTNDYFSLYDYYYKSSYGKLTLDITVLDEWFTPKKDSNYYYAATYEYYGENIAIGDQLILNEALDYLEELMDLSKFDSDNNGIIDAVILINTLDIGEEDFYWAYRYWNVYTDDEGYYYEYDGVSANDYVWASYQFLWEGYGEDGEAYYDASITNPYTFIHEFAHVLGADDYYDTAYESDDSHPLGGNDIMDAMTGDHNAYTKFNLGWLTTSRLVVTDGSVTLTLEDFGKNGDTVIIANNWDEKLGAYQEYYIVVYYTNNGLNSGDAGYFDRDGIVVYHVNASLVKSVEDGETYYDVYNNNTAPSDEYGTENNLIEFVKSAEDTYTYVEGDTLPTVTDDNGNELGYTFTVVELTDDCATITFTAA